MRRNNSEYVEIEENINGKISRRCYKNKKKVKCSKNRTKKMYNDVFDPIYYALFPKNVKNRNSKRRKNNL
jgi:hypothetical protein